MDVGRNAMNIQLWRLSHASIVEVHSEKAVQALEVEFCPTFPLPSWIL